MFTSSFKFFRLKWLFYFVGKLIEKSSLNVHDYVLKRSMVTNRTDSSDEATESSSYRSRKIYQIDGTNEFLLIFENKTLSALKILHVFSVIEDKDNFRKEIPFIRMIWEGDDTILIHCDTACVIDLKSWYDDNSFIHPVPSPLREAERTFFQESSRVETCVDKIIDYEFPRMYRSSSDKSSDLDHAKKCKIFKDSRFKVQMKPFSNGRYTG